MKLKNKKTGEIIERYIIETASAIGAGLILQDNDTNKHYQYNSLAELNAEWEDCEEPKGIQCIYYVNHFDAAKLDGVIVGFATKEEAKKAVEKLKAWKRLKDKGFRFILDGETEMPMFFYSGANGEKCITSAEESKQCRDDIKLLFRGEE